MDPGALATMLATVTERAVIVLLGLLSVTSGIGNTKHFANPGKTSPQRRSFTFSHSYGATDCETLINGLPAITGVCSALDDEFCVDDCCGGDADNMDPCDL